MKKLKFYLFALFIMFHCELQSQVGWFWLNPLPQGNWLSDVEFTTNNTVYVSGYGGTMLKSTDGGNNFVLMSNRECGESIVFINNLTGFSSSTGGILKTTNGGNNWRYITAPVDYVYDYSTNPQTILYGLKDNKVYISSDQGENWSLSLTALPNNLFYAVQFPTNNIGYVVGYKPNLFNYGRIHKTTNGGLSWDTIPTNFRFRTKGIYFLNENTGFLNTDQNRNLILKTTNNCLSWDTVSSLNYQYSQFKFFDNNNGYLKGLQEIVYTTNQGTNWTKVVSLNYTFLQNINEGLGIGVINDGNFLYKTTNTASNWSVLTSGFHDVLLDITFINSLTGFTVGDNRIYKTTNSGLYWEVTNLNINSGFTNIENIMFLNENTGYAGIDGGKLAKTTNCGLNWQVIKTGCYDHLHGLAFPSVDTGYAVTKYGFTLKTTNAGINWINFGQNPVEAYGDVQFRNNLTGFAGGTYYGNDIGYVKITTNGGTNWTFKNLDSIRVIEDVCITPSNIWFASGYDLQSKGIIYRSTDQGDSWNYIKFPLMIMSIYFPTTSIGYASASGGIMYKTTNAGENWFSTYCINFGYSNGLYFIDDQTGYGVSRYGQIIKTTTGGGVLIGVEPVSYTVPQKYNLYQNYPNPFNPVTKIKFDIPKSMNASLKIYDILGREISVIVNDFLIPATYAFDFDGSNLPSGVYFYVLNGEGFSESKKMVLVK